MRDSNLTFPRLEATVGNKQIVSRKVSTRNNTTDWKERSWTKSRWQSTRDTLNVSKFGASWSIENTLHVHDVWELDPVVPVLLLRTCSLMMFIPLKRWMSSWWHWNTTRSFMIDVLTSRSNEVDSYSNIGRIQSASSRRSNTYRTNMMMRVTTDRYSSRFLRSKSRKDPLSS